MSNIEKLKQVMRDLRDKETGCPWDIEQNFESIAPHTIEEAYEVANAIENKDYKNLKEELGDLLLQVIFHSQIAAEDNLFDFEDVVDSISEKLISRHPHVFGDSSNAPCPTSLRNGELPPQAKGSIKNSEQQEQAWEEIKQKERTEKATKQGTKSSILDDVAITLPAMTRAVKLQKRAAKVGFDWNNIDDVFAKVDEEMQELKEAINNNSNIEEEFGDLLFVTTNLGRKLKLEPEIALKKCNNKFTKRFNYIEDSLRKNNINFEDSSLEEMDRLWNESKKLETKND